MSWLKGHWQLVVLTGLVFALWQTPVMIPLKILVVFLHEVSHALAAIVTGGKVEAISISMDQGGLTTTRGGSLFVILSAGYVGSLLIGVALFLIALRSQADRAALGVLGVATLAITALFMRDWFALAFGLGSGALMLAIARFLPRDFSDLSLRIIALSSMIYVPYDIFSDTIVRANLRSDAYMLGEYVGGPTMFWGGLWLVIALGAIGLCLRFGLGQDSNLALFRPKAK